MTTIEQGMEPDLIDFGTLPEAVNAKLQQGVRAYRRGRPRAEQLFTEALAEAPDALPVYFCLYKIHTYQSHLVEAQAVAEAGLKEAARQAGWPGQWRDWQQVSHATDAGRFALYTLKALAFIHLRAGNTTLAREMLNALDRLDPAGFTGWRVVAALADGIQ